MELTRSSPHPGYVVSRNLHRLHGRAEIGHLLANDGEPLLDVVLRMRLGQEETRPSLIDSVRFAQPTALSKKVSDEFAVPLCRNHHR
jgi:hypothetical protein